ncbi:MAG TPA: hypothetical protein VMQ65_06830 [Candidatus Limnocylindria bacterium]|nr:hypothetical protein [Candidatus Limnocylindria bacterium]
MAAARKYEDTLGGYGRTNGSLHFGSAQPLPEGFVEDLVRDRLATLDDGARQAPTHRNLGKARAEPLDARILRR